MAKDQILPKGVRVFSPHANAPDFVIASLVITPNDLVQFCKENASLMKDYNGAKQIRLQVLKSKEGNYYSAVDTFEKTEGNKSAKAAAPAAKVTEEPNDDLPF